MPTTQAFVLMNLDLVAVPLQAGSSTVTIYCGERRAGQLLVDLESAAVIDDPAEDCARRYAQSAPGTRSSQRTSPLDSRSSKMQSSARNAWCLLAAFRRYPSLVPHASTYAARPSFDKELRYLSNLSMAIIYPWVK